jgi:hypothetical protein
MAAGTDVPRVAGYAPRPGDRGASGGPAAVLVGEANATEQGPAIPLATHRARLDSAVIGMLP